MTWQDAELRRHPILVAIALLWLALLQGCESDDVRPPPAELQSFTPEVEFDRLWHLDVGVGSNAQILDLRPRFMDGVLYVVDAEGLITAVDPVEGERLWEWEGESSITAGLAAKSGLLFMVEENGRLVAFDTGSQTPLWTAPLSSESVVAPLTAGDVVIVQTIDGRLTAFGLKDGVRRWEYVSATEPALSLRGNAVPLEFQDTVIAGLSNGSVVSLAVRSGELLWEQRVASPKGRTELERLVDVDSAILMADGRLFVVAYQGRLVELDPYNGAVLWAVDTSSYADMGVGYDALFLTTPEGTVRAFRRDGGARLWSNDEFAYRYLGAVLAWDARVFVPDFEGYMHVLAQSDGRLVGRFRPGSDDGIRVPAFVADDILYIYANDGTLSAWQRENE